MAYYDALIAAWNNASPATGATLPAGTTGSLLNGLTTAQKLAAVNAWTFTGSVPTVLSTSGAQLLNCINWTEFAALTAAQQTNLLMLCSVNGLLLGGSAETAFIADGMILAYFNHAGPTIAALTALAQATVQPWWQSAGYVRPFDLGDVAAAGLS